MDSELQTRLFSVLQARKDFLTAENEQLRSSLTGSVELVKDGRGMDKVVLSHSSGSVAEIYLAGGHVTSWKVPSTTGELQEQLFVSSTSKYGGGSAIRGGIPVCFPQFATDGPGKKHGFARNSEKWTVLNMQADNTRTTLRLIGDGTEDEKWPNAFVLDITLTLGAHSLQQSMKVTNTNAEAFSFTTALHTYFAVANARQTYLQGANGLSYLTTNEAKPGTFTEDRDKVGRLVLFLS